MSSDPAGDAGGANGGRAPATVESTPRSDVVRALRGLRRTTVATRTEAQRRDRCELCRASLGESHRHLIHLDERRLLCVCEACWMIRSADPNLRPAGARRQRLEHFEMPDE